MLANQVPTPKSPATSLMVRSPRRAAAKTFCLRSILGSYYLANVPTFTSGGVSGEELSVMRSVQSRLSATTSTTHTPLVTQEDIQTELANPLASAPCSLEQIQALIPGFVPGPTGAPLPV